MGITRKRTEAQKRLGKREQTKFGVQEKSVGKREAIQHSGTGPGVKRKGNRKQDRREEEAEAGEESEFQADL